MSETMIQCENLVKIYKVKDQEVMALRGLDMKVEKGELMAVMGNSGSGKSTFLNMLGGLDRPSAGKLLVDGKNLFLMKEKELCEYKKKTVGFVWQDNARNLFPYLTALQNIEVPMSFVKGNGNAAARREYALELLDIVGMSHRKNSKLMELSGGEQQRIAIAIALANKPKLLLADEPTGAVDTRTSKSILDAFRRLNEEMGITIVIVTHDHNLRKSVGRVVRIQDGQVASEEILRQSYASRIGELTSLEAEDTHDNYAVVDTVGRIKIGKEMLKEIGVEGNKVSVNVENGRIVISAPTEKALDC